MTNVNELLEANQADPELLRRQQVLGQQIYQGSQLPSASLALAPEFARQANTPLPQYQMPSYVAPTPPTMGELAPYALMEPQARAAALESHYQRALDPFKVYMQGLQQVGQQRAQDVQAQQMDAQKLKAAYDYVDKLDSDRKAFLVKAFDSDLKLSQEQRDWVAHPIKMAKDILELGKLYQEIRTKGVPSSTSEIGSFEKSFTNYNYKLVAAKDGNFLDPTIGIGGEIDFMNLKDARRQAEYILLNDVLYTRHEKELGIDSRLWAHRTSEKAAMRAAITLVSAAWGQDQELKNVDYDVIAELTSRENYDVLGEILKIHLGVEDIQENRALLVNRLRAAQGDPSESASKQSKPTGKTIESYYSREIQKTQPKGAQ